MTRHYETQLKQQLAAAERELAQWRQQGRRADRYRAAWQSARRRAEAYGEGILRLCDDRDTVYGWLCEAEATAWALRAEHNGATSPAVLVPVDGPEAAAAAVAAVTAAVARAEQAEAERDGAYRERAHLTAWLAAIHPAVITVAPDIDEPGWQLLFIIVGGRQMSWHIHPRDADLYVHVERVPVDDPRAQWDGHTTDQKYEAIRGLTARAMPAPVGTTPASCPACLWPVHHGITCKENLAVLRSADATDTTSSPGATPHWTDPIRAVAPFLLTGGQRRTWKQVAELNAQARADRARADRAAADRIRWTLHGRG
ncbi:hypothetical protein [Kitasatospora sp. NPDC090091]|uniref:hypothetical protein n=1 Tax=Kitasatospora sp. NPDC090091 TaxID=3364081 RepID=UPI0037FBD015